MQLALSIVLPLLVAAAGWYYLFHSRAASRLATVEKPLRNARRIRLRRVGGVIMILLAALLLVGFVAVDETTPIAMFLVWGGVLILLLLIVMLAILDLRLTIATREDQRRRQ